MKYPYLTLLLIIIRITQNQKSESTKVATKDGVVFNLHSKILLAERFVKTEILVPYPVYNKSVEERLVNLTNELEKLWSSKNQGCPLNFTNMTDNTAALSWIAQQTMNENENALRDIEVMKSEIRSLIRSETVLETAMSRKTRGVVAADFA